MKFIIRHEIRGRLRIHLFQDRMSLRQADLLQYYLCALPEVSRVKVYERTADAAVWYEGSREAVIRAVCRFSYEDRELAELVPQNSGRELNREYKERLIQRLLVRAVTTSCLPVCLRTAYTAVHALRYIGRGLRCLLKGRLEVEVLDAVAITVSVLRRDFPTAGSVMFLLGIGQLLEEWTYKKSVGDLARSMSLNIERVWQQADGTEVLVPISSIREGDLVTVHVGNVIPLDGVVVSGEAMVNQASMTGESLPVKKEAGMYVYAGTALEEGEITLCVKKAAGSTRFERIVSMIEESEKLKSTVEGKAATLADALVPWSLGGTALTWLLTKNTAKALSILMVDFSCALKLAMPLSVLSAMREAGSNHITVKGGRFLEAVAQADTIVFDKTGTLTKGEFKVTELLPASGVKKEELLELAAMAESCSDHPISRSIREAWGGTADMSRISGAEEISGHGLRVQLDGHTVLAGNGRLMEQMQVPYEECLSIGTVVYIACERVYKGAIVISDTIKEHAPEAIRRLKQAGVAKTVMLTGDKRAVGEAVAKKLELDEVHAELLPGDKVARVEALLADTQGKGKLAFVGDGINDAPVLSRADVGIAMGSMGSDAAIEAADVVLMDDDPAKIADVVRISRKTMRIVRQNIVFALGVKGLVLLLGALGMANMWEAVFADVGVSVLAILNAMRALRYK